MTKPDKKDKYVQELFERVSGRYDLLNRLITAGQDRAWRRFLINRAQINEAGQPGQVRSQIKILDAGAGTGDISLEAKRRYPSSLVVAADFTFGMMAAGRKRKHGEDICWCSADAQYLPFEDNFFDVVFSGYLMRNVSDINQAFFEQLRVVKPGGMVLCLDTAPPPKSLVAPMIDIYLKYALPFYGKLFSGDGDDYAYLAKSTRAFKTPEQLKEVMLRAGFMRVDYKSFMFGTQSVIWGTKPQKINFSE